jgi:hypothetical protein
LASEYFAGELEEAFLSHKLEKIPYASEHEIKIVEV